jgi:hypothetical protein
MALLTGAIPLPLAKFDKFNKPIFKGRRWQGVDGLKEVQEAALRVANKFTSRTRVIEDSDVTADFEEVVFELAEEEALLEELGMSTDPAVGKVTPERPTSPADEGDPPADSADNTDGSAKELSPKEFERQLALAKAGAPITTMNMPPAVVHVGSPIVNIPEQKAPIVKFEPKINVPEVRSPDVVVNVAPPEVKIDNQVNVPAPEVTIENNIDVPTTKSIKVERDDSGKLSGIAVQRE